MFFYLAKAFWFLARPLNLLFLAGLAALLLARLGRRRAAGGLAALVLAAFFLVGFTQLPDWLIHRLEIAVAPAPLPERIDGIIVLGGGIAPDGEARGTGFRLHEASDRLVHGLALHRRYPGTRLIYSGGVGTIRQDEEAEARTAERAIEAMTGRTGVMELETRSRNTWQNAVYVAQMVGDARTGTWLLVTSAFHMPRSLDCFRANGIDALPAPTDYRADRIRFPFLTGDTAGQFFKMSTFVKELIGLVAYRMTGRSSA